MEHSGEGEVPHIPQEYQEESSIEEAAIEPSIAIPERDENSSLTSGEDDEDARELASIKDWREKYPKPEIIAGPALPNTLLMFSTPANREWENRNMLRHVRSVLSQHLDNGTAIEANYIVNLGGDTYKHIDYGKDESGDTYNWNAMAEDPATADNYFDVSGSSSFLRNVVSVQKLSRLANASTGVLSREKRRMYEQELQDYFDAERDPVVRDVLRLAADRAEDVSISMVDMLVDSPPNYHGIAGLRTVGLEYAAQRLTDPDAVFLMYDADTVPQNNHFAQDVINTYNTYPDLKHMILGLSYRPPDSDKDAAESAASWAVTKTRGYAGGYGAGSPQISFRASAIPDVEKITGMMWQGDEDRDTAVRLGVLYGDMQIGLLTNGESLDIPVSLTSDRLDGFVDGSARQSSLKDFTQPDHTQKMLEERDRMRKEFIEELDKVEDPEERRKILLELDRTKEELGERQKVQLRMNRKIAKQFLNALAGGEIEVHDGKLTIDSEATMMREGGRALTTYVEANADMIRSLTEEDIRYMDYLLGRRHEPGVDALSPFQLAMREYLGKWVDSPELPKMNEEGFSEPRDTESRDTYLQPILAEVLALGSIRQRFFFAKEFAEYEAERPHDPYERGMFGIREPIGPRSEWVRKQLPTEEIRPDGTLLMQILERAGFPKAPLLSKLFRG